MILMNKQSTVNSQRSTVSRFTMVCGLWSMVFFIMLGFTSCGVYTFRDVSVDYSKIKTAKVGFIENKARYINPQLSPRLTDNLNKRFGFCVAVIINFFNSGYAFIQAIDRLIDHWHQDAVGYEPGVVVHNTRDLTKLF